MTRSRGGGARILGPKGVWVRLKSKDALRGAMTTEGLSMQRLADAAQCSKSMIQQLCDGSRESCTPELAARISFALNVQRDHLFVTRTSRDTRRNVARETAGAARPAGAA